MNSPLDAPDGERHGLIPLPSALYVDEHSSATRRGWPPAGVATPNPRDVDIEVTLANPNARRVRALRTLHLRLDVELDLTPFEDGGWYWFDLSTEDSELIVHSGDWSRSGPALRRATERRSPR